MSIFHRIYEGREMDAELPNQQFRDALSIWSQISSETGTLPRLSDMSSMLEKELMEWSGIAARLPDDDFEFVHFGKSVQEKTTVPFLGRSTSELSPMLRMVYRDVLDKACTTGQPLYTIHTAQVARGVTKWRRLILPIRGAGGGQYVLIIFSPHDLKKSMLDLAMDTMSEGIIGLDPEYANDGTLVDARIIIENKASCELFGVAQGALINTSLRKMMDTALGFEAFLTLADAVDARRNIEFTSLNPYGVPYVLRVGLGQIGIVLTIRQAPIAAAQSIPRKGAA